MIRRLMRALRRDPYPLYSLMRRVAPVLHDRRHDLWLLFDYASVRGALDDPGTFSSRASATGGEPLDWLIFTDPPEHSKLRGLIARSFAPRSVAGLEERARRLCGELLRPGLERGELELVGELADPLPVLMIGELLGVPTGDRARLHRWSEAILGLGDTIWGGERAERAVGRYRAAVGEMEPFVRASLQERRAVARDDLLSRLLAAEIEGERLTEREIFSFFQLLFLAGSETTTNLIGNAVLCLLEHPEQLARLRAEPGLLPNAIEEVLRYRSPVQLVFRKTTRAVRLHGRTIPEGKLVLLVVGSANRDPRRFRDAHRFDVAREPTRHLAFGHGIHFCVGAALARLEAKAALSAILERMPDLRSAGPRAWEPREGVNVLGPRRLPLRFRPERAPAVTPRREEARG